MMFSRIEPGPGQESVWDYPRPPRLEPSLKRLQVQVGEIMVADSRQAFRVLETSHPPVYYLPPSDIQMTLMHPLSHRTYCEWKGVAHYYSYGEQTQPIAWYYPQPTAAFAAIAGYVAFYPSRVDSCWVDGVLARAQAGDFYGGWITPDIVGPFKGEVGSWGW
jgi:uncharacterized protein (DUF427 family)